MPTEKPSNSYSNYSGIIAVIIMSFTFFFTILLVSYNGLIADWLLKYYSVNFLHFIRVYIFGSIGSTIMCSIFLASDKEQNELESLKSEPDPKVLRYPDKYDCWLYIARILSGGFFGVIAVLFLNTGLIAVKAEKSNNVNAFLAFILSFLIGCFQFKFINYLDSFAGKVIGKDVKQSSGSTS